MAKKTITSLQKMKMNAEKITCITAYDASFAQILAESGVDIILVGDSLGMVIQGNDSTVPVTMKDMIYHTQLVSKGNNRANTSAFLIADLPYMSYATPEQTYKNASKLMQAGAQMVKFEGGSWLLSTITGLVERGIPVCGHLGLTPQSVDALGGYQIQGKDASSANKIKQEAQKLVDAGIQMLVLECVPTNLAKEISETLVVPVIGIGAGKHTDAQVLVLYDMLGITPGFKAKFVKNFMADNNDVCSAIKSFIHEVKSGIFPTDKHSFH